MRRLITLGSKAISYIILSTLLILVATGMQTTTLNAATRYAVANGNWNSNSTWATSTSGSAGASFPGAGGTGLVGDDNATFTVRITPGISAACAKLTCGPGHNRNKSVAHFACQ